MHDISKIALNISGNNLRKNISKTFKKDIKWSNKVQMSVGNL